MSKGEQAARTQLPAAEDTTEKDITVAVGRFRYRFELWRDAIGQRFWKRGRLPKKER